MGRLGMNLGAALLKGLSCERMIPGIWAWPVARMVVLLPGMGVTPMSHSDFCFFLFFIIIHPDSTRVSAT